MKTFRNNHMYQYSETTTTNQSTGTRRWAI